MITQTILDRLLGVYAMRATWDIQYINIFHITLM